MININGHGISISRGDTGDITMNFTGTVPEDDTVAVITLKKSPKAQQTIWEKRINVSNGSVVLELGSEDTNLIPNTYFWDMRLLMSGERVYTPIKPAPFQILEVIGSAE